MKKIISILILFLSCYFIYNITIDDELFYLSIGDGIAKGITDEGNVSVYNYTDSIKNYLTNKNKLKGFNNSFVDKDYRITDLLRIIKYKEEIVVNKKHISINELLKQADIVTISLGMNELYYKILVDNNNIYSYIDGMLSDMELLLKEVDRYNHKKVIVLGYYNTTNNNKDIFNYVNYKLKNIVDKRGFEFVDIDKIINNNRYNIMRIYISMTFVMAEGEIK